MAGHYAYLVRMRSRDEDNRTPPWNFPRAARMDLAEEKVNQYGKRPEEYIVYPVRHLRVVPLLLRGVRYMLLDFWLFRHLGWRGEVEVRGVSYTK